MRYQARLKLVKHIAAKRVGENEARLSFVQNVQMCLVCFLAAVLVVGGFGCFLFDPAICCLFITTGCASSLLLFSHMNNYIRRYQDRLRLYRQLLGYITLASKKKDSNPFLWENVRKVYNFLENKPLEKGLVEHNEHVQSHAKNNS